MDDFYKRFSIIGASTSFVLFTQLALLDSLTTELLYALIFLTISFLGSLFVYTLSHAPLAEESEHLPPWLPELTDKLMLWSLITLGLGITMLLWNVTAYLGFTFATTIFFAGYVLKKIQEYNKRSRDQEKQECSELSVT